MTSYWLQVSGGGIDSASIDATCFTTVMLKRQTFVSALIFPCSASCRRCVQRNMPSVNTSFVFLFTFQFAILPDTGGLSSYYRPGIPARNIIQYTHYTNYLNCTKVRTYSYFSWKQTIKKLS